MAQTKEIPFFEGIIILLLLAYTVYALFVDPGYMATV